MNKLDKRDIEAAFIDVSKYGVVYNENGFTTEDDSLLKQLIAQLTQAKGYAIIHGVKTVLNAQGLDIKAANVAEHARSFFKSIFEEGTQKIDFEQFSVNVREYGPTCNAMVDGYNVNVNFAVSDDVPSRRAVTTKCIHFDGNSPFIANIYGPFENIVGGEPIISDVHSFCQDHDVDVKNIIENIPESYGIAISEQFYDQILHDYSFAVKADFTNDIVMIALHNQISGGIAHGAITPDKADESLPALRPIYHLEYEFQTMEDYHKWYNHYGLEFNLAGDAENDGANFVLDYHNNLSKPFNNFVSLS